MSGGILELAIVVLLATVLGVIARFLRQPLILAFIFAGAIISYFGFFNLNNQEVLRTLSDLGIMFLLFLVGLEIDFKSLKLIGKSAFLIGFFQMILTAGLALLLSKFLNFNYLESIYLSGALTFSSTIIVIKVLSEKRDTTSLYGKISVGVLLFQDLIAILALVILSGIKSDAAITAMPVVIAVAKAAALFVFAIAIGRKVLPFIMSRFVNHSQELIFISTLAWCFLMAALVSHPLVGFPIEIAGLLAGLALSNSAASFQIFSKIKYLRDFFVVIFFVILGSSLAISNFSKLIIPIAAFSLFILIIKPLIILLIMGISGYREKTGFLTGMSLAQISEFSFVLAAIGLKLNHINENVVSIITAAGIISIAASVYMMHFSEGLFRIFRRPLSIFERRNLKEKIISDHNLPKPIVLIGSHRLGQSIAFNLRKEDLLIIDFDPEVIEVVKKHGYDYLFGDISDDEVFEKANFENAKVVISASPDFKSNLELLQKLNNLRKKGYKMKVIIRAEDEKEVETLYKLGADYVIFPHFTSGQYLGRTIAIDPQMKILEELRAWDLNTLRKLERKNSN